MPIDNRVKEGMDAVLTNVGTGSLEEKGIGTERQSERRGKMGGGYAFTIGAGSAVGGGVWLAWKYV